MRVTRLLVLLAMLSFVVFVSPLPTDAEDCTRYAGVGVQYFPGFGYACGGWNSGCTECITVHQGGRVTTCVFQNQDNIYCVDQIDYQTW
jgi:hypothetical protein